MATLHRLILASSSFGRKTILTQAGYTFEVMPSHIDEHDGTGVTDPRRYVAELAWQKAQAVSKKLSAISDQRSANTHPTPHQPLSTEHSAQTTQHLSPSTLILAADSTVWHQKQIIGKPVDEADARRILSSLAGTTHELWTGVCLWRLEDGLQYCWQEKSDLYFRPLSADELEYLIQSKVWEGKAGGYGIESVGDPYLTVKTGTISNVIGLPVESLTAVLRQIAPELTHRHESGAGKS